MRVEEARHGLKRLPGAMHIVVLNHSGDNFFEATGKYIKVVVTSSGYPEAVIRPYVEGYVLQRGEAVETAILIL